MMRFDDDLYKARAVGEHFGQSKFSVFTVDLGLYRTNSSECNQII